MRYEILLDGVEAGILDLDGGECLECTEPALDELVAQSFDEGFPVDVDKEKGSVHYTELNDENIGVFAKFLEDHGYELGDEVEAPEDEDGEGTSEYEPVPENEETEEVTGHRSRDNALERTLRLGDVEIAGFPVVIEHKSGEERYGKRLPADYGYIRRTGSAEGQDVQMDCFVRDPVGKIFIVDSYTPDGKFDEHKIMIGYDTADAALHDFHDYYCGGVSPDSGFSGRVSAPDKRVGLASPITANGLSAWLDAGDITRPFRAPLDVDYTANAKKSSERCAVCEYYDNGFCTNRKVQRDPKVPTAYDGAKLVSPSGWCKEFERDDS